jgi:hypothetical protein
MKGGECEAGASSRYIEQRKLKHMNALAKVSHGTAPATQVSPWREAVNDEAGANFGIFLKFAKGEWLLGEEGSPVPPEARFVANMDEIYRGWVRWWDGKPTDHLIGRVIDRHHVQKREELGNLDQSQWETEPNGARRDPWARSEM